jgi:signal transduction histidine kinase
MSSDQGIFRVPHDTLHAVADAVERGEQPARRLTPIVFTESEGMPNRESNRGSPGGWRLDDGRLVFNNLAGVVVIDPRRVAQAPPPPRAVIHGVSADGVVLPPGEVQISARTRQLSIDFAALSYVAPEQNHFRYRVDGYDRDWVDAGTVRRATYTNLSPGRFTFRVQGATSTGDWSGAEATVPFEVVPIVWQTLWFRLLIGSALAALLVVAYRYRVQRLLEMERLRLRIASDLHDDVGSNLSSIALLSDMLKDVKQLDVPEQRQIRRINTAAEETIGALRDIIWLVDPKHGDLVDLIVRMRGVASDMLIGHAWTFTDGDATAHPLSMVTMRNTLLIYKEVLHNIVKHAQAQRVTITIGTQRDRLLLVVEDDGVGFDASAVHAGHGVASMRRRAEQSQGTLTFERARPHGTRVTFSTRLP